MGALIALAALMGALLLGLTLAGFWGSLAALQLLVVLGVALFAAGMAILLYRLLLHNWVRKGHHPFVLRLVAVCTGVLIWLALVAVWFRDTFFATVRWPLEQALGPLALWMLLVVAVFFATVCGLEDRRRRFRSM